MQGVKKIGSMYALSTRLFQDVLDPLVRFRLAL
jgi:hypothetical protein